jgi:hypothetical protein
MRALLCCFCNRAHDAREFSQGHTVNEENIHIFRSVLRNEPTTITTNRICDNAFSCIMCRNDGDVEPPVQPVLKYPILKFSLHFAMLLVILAYVLVGSLPLCAIESAHERLTQTDETKLKWTYGNCVVLFLVPHS